LYPREPETDEEREIQKRYQSVLGSAVNPVLREGNSDRRVAPPVKAYAQKNPHRLGICSRASRTHVAHMTKGDFYSSEQATTIGSEPTSVRIEFIPKNGGEAKLLKKSIPLEAGEVIDASFMNLKALGEFYEQEIEDAKETETLFSLHLKATMMKVSDPVMFGQCIRVFYKDAFDKHGATLEEIGANPNQGLASIFEAVKNKLDESKAKEILADFESCYENRPWLAMVDSDRGITNLHAPNDIIIDASMPVVIRDSGRMWNKLGVRSKLAVETVGTYGSDTYSANIFPVVCFIFLFFRNWRIASALSLIDVTRLFTKKLSTTSRRMVNLMFRRWEAYRMLD
jgi:isocitrate dehydrogenase